jgi:hypothetical protein
VLRHKNDGRLLTLPLFESRTVDMVLVGLRWYDDLREDAQSANNMASLRTYDVS